MDDGAIVIKDVSHVSIGVSDMARSIAFYRDVFGWEQIFDERMEGEAFEALTGVPGAAGQACGGRIGSLRVELMHFNFIPDTMAPSGLGLRVLSMEVADAHAAHDELVARGVPRVGAAGRGVRGAHVLRDGSRRSGHRDVRVRCRRSGVGRGIPMSHHQPRVRTMWAMLAVAVLAASAVSVSAIAGFAAVPAAKKPVVTIKGFEFKPSPLTVKAGTKITVKNSDSTTHTFTANKGAFDAGKIDSGDSATITVKKPGTYAYHCEIHNFMKGTIKAT